MSDMVNTDMEMEVETEVVADDDDMDVVDMDQNDSHGVFWTAAKAVIGAGLAVGTVLGIRKAAKKRQEKYIMQTPKGLIRCK